MIVQITGSVMDDKGVTRFVIKGHWDGQFTLAKVEGESVTAPRVLWSANPPE